MPKRIWFYRHGGWLPQWQQYLVPGFGGDEYGRKTIVIHIPMIGFLVWAYKNCYCEDCEDIRHAAT